MDTILTVVDLNASPQKVIDETHKYARALDARVVLVDVEPLLPGAEGASAEEVTRDLQDSYSEEIRTVQEFGDELTASGIETRVLVIEGTAADQLLREVDREGPGLIVIPSYPHGALIETLTHGIREQLAKKVRCPVLLVPVE